MISFVVPAHNEQACLPRTLQAIHDSARAVNQPYEVIVVDDASTDGTAEVASKNNAIVVSVTHRQIAATRNSGARAARGERIFFVDADTTINPRAVAAALREMDKGSVGGGATVYFEGDLPLYVRVLSPLLVFGVIANLVGGAFLFCTRDAFQRCGGFNEKMYFSEEGSFVFGLKRLGRFVVIWPRVHTSGRRFRTTTALDVLVLCARTALSPARMITQRSSSQKIWYDSDRSKDDHLPNSFVAKVSNGIVLVALIVLITGPVWGFVPWKWTPLGSPMGIIRFMIAAFLTHVGVLFFWPCAVLLAFELIINLINRRWWANWITPIALCVICFWQAWGSMLGAIWVWKQILIFLAN